MPARESKLIDRVLTRAMREELVKEPDEQRALRKAFLLLLYLIEDTASEELADFIDYLLLEFPPLSRFFVEHRHPFIGEQAIMRARSSDENHTVLLLQEQFVKQLIQEDL
jgi:hypothetical protein